MNLVTAVEMNREPREPREKRELERDGRRRDSCTRRVKKAFSESPSPFAYFAYFAVSAAAVRINTLTLKIQPKSGLFQGSFVPPGSGKLNREPRELREPRENSELERDGRRRDSCTRQVKKAFSESSSPFAYFAVVSASIRMKTSFKSEIRNPPVLRSSAPKKSICGTTAEGGKSEIVRAFTLIELLVVIGIIAILASLLLPALTSAKNKTKSTGCLNNLKQLQTAYLSYAHNNDDALVPNYSRNIDLIQQGVAPSWVLGNAKQDRSTTNIEAGLLYPEIGNAAVYRCPSDQSSGPPPLPLRFRSYSLSGWASASDVEGKGEKFTYAPIRKLAQLNVRPLTAVFAFIDEHSDSIDDGVFAVYARENRMEWKDLPADRHTRGCNLSFLDGHVEPWRWQAPKIFRDYDQRPANASDMEDLLKVQDHLSKVNN